MCKRVVADDDYHRWEYRSESETGGVIYNITLECDRREERRLEGYGPCTEITFEYDNRSLGTIGDPGICYVCFGPLIMNDRRCACLPYDQPDRPYQGFSWGNSYITGEVINGDPSQTCDCQFMMDSDGDTIEAVCICQAICVCVGVSKALHFSWSCDGYGDIELDLDWYDADDYPPTASLPPDWGAGGAWWGRGATGISGCEIEVQLQCVLSAFDPPLIILHDSSTQCDAYEADCTTPNLVPQFFQCRDDTTSPPTPFLYEWAFCTVSGQTPCCDGTNPDPPCFGADNRASIFTITERD